MGATTLTGNATFDQATGTTLVLGPISETGTPRSITKTGLGTLSLPAASTYTGGTTISAGTLQVSNSTGSATGSGTAVIASAATLSGTGAIGPVNLSGHLSPGIGLNGIGTITLGATNLATGSNLDYDFSSLTNDSAHAGADSRQLPECEPQFAVRLHSGHLYLGQLDGNYRVAHVRGNA